MLKKNQQLRRPTHPKFTLRGKKRGVGRRLSQLRACLANLKNPWESQAWGGHLEAQCWRLQSRQAPWSLVTGQPSLLRQVLGQWDTLSQNTEWAAPSDHQRLTSGLKYKHTHKHMHTYMHRRVHAHRVERQATNGEKVFTLLLPGESP